jgi:transcriptional regulator with XRE-family HTH domain
MSIIQPGVSPSDMPPEVQVPVVHRPLHRLGIVRRLQGISRRTLARRLNTDVVSVKLQERPVADMMLSKLYEWQRVLEVPITELLVEAEDELAMPVLKRAQLVRLMKTALGIQEVAKDESICRMAQTLVAQLTEIMPELESVSAWHSVGRRRRQDELGVAVDRRLSEDVFLDLID